MLSCSDFLNIRPEGASLSSELDYSKAENVFKPVSAAYASLRSGNVHGFSYICILGISSDNAYKGSTPEDNPNAQEFDDMEFGPNNSLLNELWTGYYDVVSAANNAIHKMPLFDAATENKEQKKLIEQCLGEARFIRAYAYFNLVRCFGRIPIIDNVLSAAELAEIKQATAIDVLEFLDEDLAYACEHLPESYPKSDAGRVTKYAALALRAKAELYKSHLLTAEQDASFTKVAQYTDAIISSHKHKLESDFRFVFSMDGENCAESLFEIQSSTLGKTSGEAPYCEYAYFQGPRNNTPGNMQGWGFCVPSQELIDFYESRSEVIRPATTILYRGTTTPEGDVISANCPNPCYNGKVYTPSAYNKWNSNGYGFDHNIRILRYADVLLMYAEALVRGADTGKLSSGYSADGALNEVRFRAGLDSIAADLDIIIDERRAEFALEEDRYFDLVRTGKAVNSINGFVSGKHEFFPIPSNQLQLNNNLTQNTGY